MPKEHKSPQEKKQLQLKKDHFTFSEAPHKFRKTWKRKKALVNREFRRKTDSLLAQAKPAMSLGDAELITGELTTAHLKKSVTRKRLHKTSTVSLGEKVKLKLEKRAATTGRRVRKHERYDILAKQTLETIWSLGDAQLAVFAKRADLICRGGDSLEFSRIYGSKERSEQALLFLHGISFGSATEIDSLRRNQEVRKGLAPWTRKAIRIFAKEEDPGRKTGKGLHALYERLTGCLTEPIRPTR